MDGPSGKPTSIAFPPAARASPVAAAPPLERESLVCLGLVPGVGPGRLGLLLGRFGSAAAVWTAGDDELRNAGLPEEVVASLLAQRRRLDPATVFSKLRPEGLKVLTTLDESYPARLSCVPGCPPVLFGLGDPTCLAQPAVAVVGTRRPTPYGLEVTDLIAGGLAEAGLVIVSGLAVGIDAAAHRAALEVGGRTIAVLGSSLDKLYPGRHSGLAAEITAAGGMVISQFRPDTLPGKGNFVARNRVVAGLSLGVVVCEAPSKSGALITARMAAGLGRPVLAVPGPVGSPTSAGCLELMRAGARAVNTAGHVLEDLGLPVAAWLRPAPSTAGRPSVSDDSGTVLAAMQPGETLTFDRLMARTRLGPETLASVLGLMEVKGLVTRQPGQRYTRA
jgi:DNA processing protein